MRLHRLYVSRNTELGEGAFREFQPKDGGSKGWFSSLRVFDWFGEKFIIEDAGFPVVYQLRPDGSQVTVCTYFFT